MARRITRRAIPKLSHEAVREHLLDYHFSRLSPELNAAIERHVRSCETCQREGLFHLATQKREAVRLSRRRRGPSTRRARLARFMELAFTLCLLALLALVGTARGIHLPWSSRQVATPSPTRLPTATPVPTPLTLSAALTFAAASTSSVALALSPDGKSVALAATLAGGTPVVSTWDAKSGVQQHVMSYYESVAPGVLAWSPDGTRLAAANGSVVMAWNVASGLRLWTITLPQSTALRVYDVQSAVVVQRPDPAVIFAQGAFAQWGPNGQIASAPANAAGQTGTAMPNGPIVGFWQVSGSHIFPASGGQTDVGISSADVASHVALLSWSPDNRYLLWGTVARPVALGGTQAVTGSPGAAASATVVPAPAPGASPPPNALALAVAGHVAASHTGDALLWFAPNGMWVAYCDRTVPAAPLNVAVSDQSRAVEEIPGACAGLTAAALTWRSDSTGFLLATAAHPVMSYILALTAHG